MRNIFFNVYRYLFANTRCIKFNKLLVRLGYRGLGILNYENDIISGEYFVVNSILPKYFAKRRLTIFDVGANVGNFVSILVDRFPESDIFAFEPHPKNFEKLSKKIFDNLICYEFAFGDSIGTAKIYDYSDEDGSEHASLVKEVITDIHNSKIVSHEIEVNTIDNFILENKITKINFLKIDTEGYEFSVLEGAKISLENNKIDLILFEFNSMNIVSRVFLRDFKTILLNYKLFRVLPNGLLNLEFEEEMFKEVFAFQNILAISKNL